MPVRSSTIPGFGGGPERATSRYWVAATLVVLSVVGTSCTGLFHTDQDEGLRLARSTCPESLLDGSSGSGFNPATMSAEARENAKKTAVAAANTAGKAARLDPTWNELGEAYSDWATEMQVLFTLIPEDPAEPDPDRAEYLVDTIDRYNDSLRRITAQCRKTVP